MNYSYSFFIIILTCVSLSCNDTGKADRTSSIGEMTTMPVDTFLIPKAFKANTNLNKRLVALLDTIYHKDQTDRLSIDSLQKQFGWQPKQIDSLWRKISYQDSVNLINVKRIIDAHGWPGPGEVGEQGAATLFLVIQHADSLTQVTYLPKMREAVKKGKARSQDLAFLEDRILTKQEKKQVYGSQLRRNATTGKNEFFPIEDEANVNKRRAAVGLPSLEEYARHFDLQYVLPKRNGTGK